MTFFVSYSFIRRNGIRWKQIYGFALSLTVVFCIRLTIKTLKLSYEVHSEQFKVPEMERTASYNQKERFIIRLAKGCKSVLRILFVIINNLYCIPTYVVWMIILYPVKKCHPDLYWRIEGLFFHWLLAMVSMWSWSAGYDIVEMGDDIRTCVDERTLIIANHQSTADVPMLMACFNAKKNVLPNLMWIMDRLFKFSNFGIVSVLHEDFFIVSGKARRDASLNELSKHLHNSFIPRHRKWIVLFPEGGFLRKRRATSQSYAEKNNLPILKNVSLPRVGALRVIMENIGYPNETMNLGIEDKTKVRNHTLEPRQTEGSSRNQDGCVSTFLRPPVKDASKIRWILDITIAYPGGVPLDLPTIVTGSKPPCQTFMFYRVYKSSQIPVDKEDMTNWLYKIFQEKEEMLEKFYNTGVFPTEEFCQSPIPDRLVVQNNLRENFLRLTL